MCRILNWESNEESVVYGYKKNDKTKTCPIFVTYQKNKQEGDSTDYKDFFIDNYQFFWQSKSGKKISDNKIKKGDETLEQMRTNELKIPLFVTKSDNEDGNFYYMGDCSIRDANDNNLVYNDKQNIIKKGKKTVTNIVNMIFDINPPVKDDILNYLNMETTEDE